MVQLLVTGGSRLHTEVQAALEGAPDGCSQGLREGCVVNPDSNDPCAVAVTVPALRLLAAQLHREVRSGRHGQRRALPASIVVDSARTLPCVLYVCERVAATHVVGGVQGSARLRETRWPITIREPTFSPWVPLWSPRLLRCRARPCEAFFDRTRTWVCRQGTAPWSPHRCFPPSGSLCTRPGGRAGVV